MRGSDFLPKNMHLILNFKPLDVCFFLDVLGFKSASYLEVFREILTRLKFKATRLALEIQSIKNKFNFQSVSLAYFFLLY